MVNASLLHDKHAADHPGYAAFSRQMWGRSYNEEQLNRAWAAFKAGWEGDAEPSTHLTRRLTTEERRRIGHALRQLAEAGRQHLHFDPPPGMSPTEIARLCSQFRAEIADHERLAGEIERNGLQFTDPTDP